VPADVLRQTLEAQGRWTGELVQKRRDQQPIDVESRMVLARDPDGNRVVIETNRPITERKRMEQTLRERAEQLTNDDRAKNEFLAMLGHELRNPLAPLRNAAEILKQSSTKEPILASVREMIMRQVNAMARMVDDLLDVARITGHTLELRRSVVDLGSVIKHSVEMAQPEFERRDQKLSVALPQEPIYVDGDAVRLEQIFDNLLLNASKFSPSTGQISLSMQRPASAEAGGSTPRFATYRTDWLRIRKRPSNARSRNDWLKRSPRRRSWLRSSTREGSTAICRFSMRSGIFFRVNSIWRG